MVYARRTWQNAPSSATPLNATSLNNIEDGVEEATNAVRGIGNGISNLIATFFETNVASFPISKYGDIKQAVFITDAEMTSGSAVLHSDSYTFTNADVGKAIGVRGAAPVSADYSVLANDGVLVTTIASVSGGNATLAAAATATCAGTNATFGFPINAALVAADAAAAAAGGGNVLIPKGRWIATVAWELTPGNGVIGAGRDLTKVHYVHTGTGADSTASFIRSGGLGYTKSLTVSDFTLDGQFFVATTGVGSNMKMLQVTSTESSIVTRMRIENNPATAIGYDESRRLLIEDCIITNAGRLSPRGTGAGYSALGITVGDLDGPASCIIRGNFIDGGWLPDEELINKNSHTGIHLEGIFNDSTDAGADPQDAYIIEGNIITRCGIGVRDSGSLGTIINANRITECGIGVSLANKGGSNSRVPLETIVTNNVIRDMIAPAVISGLGYGIYVNSATTTYTNIGRFVISGNTITAAPVHGIYIFAGGAPLLQHIRVSNNMISECGEQGIHLRGGLRDIQITNNNLIANCLAAPTNPQAILIHNSTTWTDGRISGNSLTDYQTVPTQSNIVGRIGTPTLTNVFIGDNGESSPALQSDARLKYKGSTSTITSNTTMATLSAFTVPMEAGVYYEFTARICYTSGVTPGFKLGLFLSGSAAEWWVDGPGAPTTRVSGTDVVTLNGGSGTLVATIRGWVAASSNFNFGIQGAQAVSDAASSTVTTASRLSVRRVSLI